MSKLTSREKALGLLLILVLLGLGLYYVFAPAVAVGETLDRAIADAELQNELTAQITAQQPAFETGLALSRTLIQQNEDGFLPAMNNDDLDRYVTGLLQKNGLVAESLLISVSEDAAENIAVMRLNVKVTATGSMEQFMALTQQISHLTGIRMGTFVVEERTLTRTEAARAAEAAAKAAKEGGTDGEAAEPEEQQYRIALGLEIVEYDEAVAAALIG